MFEGTGSSLLKDYIVIMNKHSLFNEAIRKRLIKYFYTTD